MRNSPGLGYLAERAPRFVLQTALTFGTIRLAQQLLDLDIPLWLIIALSVGSRPLVVLVDGQTADWRAARRAKALGASLAPKVEGNPYKIVKNIFASFVDGYPGTLVSRWMETYGPCIRFTVLGTETIVTMEPEHVKAIVSTQFENFEKGAHFLDQFQSMLGTGIFNADGELWKFHRGITRPFFTRDRISDFDIYDRKTALAIQTSQVMISEGYSIDVQDWANRFTLDAATEFLCGHSVDSLSAGLAYPQASGKPNSENFRGHPSNTFVEAFVEGLRLASHRTAFGSEWRLIEFAKDKVRPLRDIIDEFASPVMDRVIGEWEAKAKGPEKEKTGDEPTTLLEYLVSQTQDKTILMDELVNLLVAGRDTTGSLLTMSFAMMCQHPELEHKLRQEIFNVVGSSGRPTHDQMRDLKYVRAFLNEVLRLYPSVPFDIRCAVNDTVLPATRTGGKPIFVPAGMKTLYSLMNMHRRADLWGPDALKFDPDRFLDDRLGKYLTPNPFIFLPFNGGPRICLGQQFAYHEATFFLVKILQTYTNFRFDEHENLPTPASWKTLGGRIPMEPVYLTAGVTLSVKGGLWVKMDEYRGRE